MFLFKSQLQANDDTHIMPKKSWRDTGIVPDSEDDSDSDDLNELSGVLPANAVEANLNVGKSSFNEITC